jgi:hypothetical protein
MKGNGAVEAIDHDREQARDGQSRGESSDRTRMTARNDPRRQDQCVRLEDDGECHQRTATRLAAIAKGEGWRTPPRARPAY